MYLKNLVFMRIKKWFGDDDSNESFSESGDWEQLYCKRVVKEELIQNAPPMADTLQLCMPTNF